MAAQTVAIRGRWITLATAALVMLGGAIANPTPASAKAIRTDDPNQALRDITDLAVSMLQSRLSTEGARIDLSVYFKENASARSFVIGETEKAEILAQLENGGARLHPNAQLFFKNLEQVSFKQDFIHKTLKLSLDMTEWTALAAKDPTLAKQGEIVAIGVPTQVRYTLSVQDKAILIAADSPREQKAIRFAAKGAPSSIWFRELLIDFETFDGQINLGMFGNRVGMIARFKINLDAPPGENPISVQPEVWETAKENPALLLFLPFLILLI